jgi:hypothetical protein
VDENIYILWWFGGYLGTAANRVLAEGKELGSNLLWALEGRWMDADEKVVR